MNLTRVPALGRVLQDWRDAGAAGHQQHRTVSLPQVTAAEWTPNPQSGAHRQPVKLSGEGTAVDHLDDELELLRGARRRRQGVGPPLTCRVRHRDLHELARVKGYRRLGADPQPAQGRCQFVDPGHLPVELPRRDQRPLPLIEYPVVLNL